MEPGVGKLSVLHYSKWGVWACMGIRNSKAALKGLEKNGIGNEWKYFQKFGCYQKPHVTFQ
jgi:hypothetical protein